jgi:hypothetical protein
MDLVHRTSMKQKADGQSDVYCFGVEQMRRFLVKFNQARCFRVRFIFYGASLVELEEGCRIDLA